MPISENTLEKYIVQLRRAEKSRLAGAERNIKRIYRALMKDLTAFVGEEYQKYAREDKLTVDILQEKRRYARFLEEATEYVDKSVPEAMKLVKKTVEETYKACYEGMGKAVSQTHEDLKDVGAMTVRPEVLKQAVENPISGLTLPDTLQKHRQEVVYNIKQQLNIGLLNGDSYVTMAKRINTILSGDDGTGGAYGKAMNIVRTETHRVREAGFLNCAENLSEGIEERGLIYAATWRTMKDEKVRPKTRTHSSKGWRTVIRGSANHEKMEGVTIKVGEEFDLGGRVKTKCPGMSGDAANDCNCRCYLEYNLMTVEQFARITGKSVAEVEKTMSPATKNSQFYKAATLDYEDEIKTERQDEITLYRASTTNNTIYVSDKVPQFKPKELHEIDMNISKTLKLLNIDKEANLPKVYIIGKDEMAKSAIASYSAVENAMFLVDMRGFDKDAIKDLMSGLACPKNELSTYVHEYIHWKDAEEYRKLGHAITNSKEYADYIAKLQKRALKNIDKLIKSGYNINDISAYAFSSYVQGYYDEAYTEYLVKTFMKE